MGILCKLSGAFLVIASTVYFAQEINANTELRLKQLIRLKSILLEFKSELKYLSSTLPECFTTIASHAQYPFDKWLNNMALAMNDDRTKNFSEIWIGYIAYLREDSALEDSDLEILKNLKDKLNCADIDATVGALDYCLVQLEECRKSLNNVINEKKKTVISLSLFVGFITVILLF